MKELLDYANKYAKVSGLDRKKIFALMEKGIDDYAKKIRHNNFHSTGLWLFILLQKSILKKDTFLYELILLFVAHYSSNLSKVVQTHKHRLFTAFWTRRQPLQISFAP